MRTPRLRPQSHRFLGALELLNGFLFLALLVPSVTIITFLLFWQQMTFNIKPNFPKHDEWLPEAEPSANVGEQFTRSDTLPAPQ